MAFDINKYDDKYFHENKEMDNRIKVLLLWYEFQSEQHKLDVNGQIKLIDSVIQLCVKQEWYEIATFFKKRKDKLVNNG